MNTVKIQQKGNTKIIAHRGVSGLETENSLAAFVAAGNRSYFGIETDIHLTADGKFIVHHDDRTGRVADKDLPIEKSKYADLRALSLKDHGGNFGRCDMKLPNLTEYIETCKHYEKKAILEIKNPFGKADIERVCDEIKRLGWLENTVFISFDFQNLIFVRECFANASVQFLCEDNSTKIVDKVAACKMDIDIYFPCVTPEFVRYAHKRGVKVNCWTVNEPADADRLIEYGADFITTNILE